MKRAYVKAVRGARRVADGCGLLAELEKSDRRSMQWLRSLFGIYDSADLVHLDVPWWTYRAIDEVGLFLDARHGRARVFEYGAGASTVWLSRRCVEVHSVEHDAGFARMMAGIFDRHANISVRVVEPVALTGGSADEAWARSNRKGYTDRAFDAYVSSIDDVEGAFDLIVIDGRARVACLRHALPRLAAGGVILFDNSDRREYRSGIEACGLHETILRGMAPALPMPGQTSLLKHR